MNFAERMNKPPEFLFCESEDGRVFVFHPQNPCLLFEFDDDGYGTHVPLAPEDMRIFMETELLAGREPATSLARIAREAGEFFNRMLDEA